MANLLLKLRKENNERDKLLSKENQLLMADLVVYLRGSNLCDYDIEVIRRELFGMIYEAQARGETAEQVIGGNYKDFCEALMKNGRQKDLYERILEWAYILVVGIGVLLVIEVAFSGLILGLIARGSYSMPITLGFAVSSVMIVSGALAVYRYLTRHAFELPEKGLSRYRIAFIIGFTLYFAGCVAIKVFLGDISLLQVNIFIPAAIFIVSFLIVKVLGDRNSNLIAKTHN